MSRTTSGTVEEIMQASDRMQRGEPFSRHWTCPQPRDTGETAQAMAIGREGQRLSKLTTCLDAASIFQLDPMEARALIDEALTTVREQWIDEADTVGLPQADRNALWGRAILHPYPLEGYTPTD